MDPFISKPRASTREDAETLAIEALAFLAAEEARLSRFMAITGYDLAGIKAEAGSAQFLAGVLDYLMSDESLLLVFASHGGVDPSALGRARRAIAPDLAVQD